MLYSTDYESPIGKILIMSDGEAICGAYFYGQKNFPSLDGIVQNDDLAIFRHVKQWFDDYFSGLNPEIDFEVKLQGSEFRLQVWRILSRIPYGETLTYGAIAREISPKMSAQAVGGAVGHNPVSIIIPCHRVLGTGGKPTGYAAGIDKKLELLKIEKFFKSCD